MPPDGGVPSSAAAGGNALTRDAPVRPAVPRGRVLVIDDEPGIRSIAARALTASGFAVDLAATGRQGLSMALRKTYDLVLLDLHLPDLGGEELLGRLRRQQPRQAVLTWSATADRQAVSRCRFLGACGHLAKPFTLAELMGSVTGSLAIPCSAERSRRGKQDRGGRGL